MDLSPSPGRFGVHVFAARRWPIRCRFQHEGLFGGRCDLRRTAKIDKGVIRLDAAVAEYLTRTYNTLYVIRVLSASVHFLISAAEHRGVNRERPSVIPLDAGNGRPPLPSRLPYGPGRPVYHMLASGSMEGCRPATEG